jgi:hypothetical protein
MVRLPLACLERLLEFLPFMKNLETTMEEIMKPVIALAKKGVIVVTAKQEKQLQTYRNDIVKLVAIQTLCQRI